MFDEMPPLKFTGWLDADSCELVKWTVDRALELGEEIDATEAIRRYKSAWKCSNVPGRKPLRKDPKTGLVCNRNHYLPHMFRWMPRLTEQTLDFWEWVEAEVKNAGEPDKLLETAIGKGDVIVLNSAEEDSFSDLRLCIGAETHAAEMKAQEEAERAEREAKKAEESRKPNESDVNKRRKPNDSKLNVKRGS